MAELFDADQNPVEGAMTADEVEEKLNEQKEEIKQEFQNEINDTKDELEEKKALLETKETELAKEKEKDKNLGGARKSIEEKEKEIADLKEEMKGLNDKIDSVGQEAKSQKVDDAIDKKVGGDKELSKKVRHYYDQFKFDPAKDDQEKFNERIDNAYTLATGGQKTDPLDGKTISSGGGSAPVQHQQKEGGKKLEDPRSSEVAEKLGIDQKEQKEKGLI